MIPLPPHINPEAWDGFCQMRKSMGKAVPFTQRAAVLIMLELQKLKDQGYDPNECLDQSTMKGWRGVFPTPHKPVPEAAKQANKWLQEQAEHRAKLEESEAKERNNAARIAAMAKLKPLKRVA